MFLVSFDTFLGGTSLPYQDKDCKVTIPDDCNGIRAIQKNGKGSLQVKHAKVHSNVWSNSEKRSTKPSIKGGDSFFSQHA